MAPKSTLSISQPDAGGSSPECQTVARFGEPARAHVSPYSSPNTYLALNPLRSSAQPYISPFASPSPRSYQSPYATPSPTTPADCEPYHGTMDSPLPSPSSKRAKRSLPPSIPASTSPTAKKFKGETYYNNAERLLENESSPLYKDETNLKLILQHPMAQAFLATTQTGQQLPNTYSDEFASAAAAFKEDGQAGRHDPEWTAQAAKAGLQRRTGAFDEYSDEKFAKSWSAESAQLSDDENEIPANNGCHDDTEQKPHRRDNSDDDRDGSYYGGKSPGFGPSYSTPGNGYNNSNHDKASSNGSESKKHGGNSNGYGKRSHHRSKITVFDADSIHDNTLKFNIKTTCGHYELYRPPYLPTRVTTPSRSSFGQIYSPINDQKEMITYRYAPFQRQPELPYWQARGYVDNPKSVYPLLDGSLFNLGY